MKWGLATLVSTGVLLAGWQLIAMLAGQPEIIPSVFRLLQTLAALFASGSFYLSAGATLARGIAGILLSLAIALAAAGLLARFNRLYDLFRPLLAIMRSTPVISFILLALIFLHAESIPLLTGFLTMFPLLTENLIKGIRALRPGLALMAKPFGITGRNYVTQIIYPQLKPFLYSGLASAAGFGWRAIVMGEALSQCRFGIGSEMKQAQAFIAVPELLAWTTVAVLIGFLADKGINRLSACHIPAAYPTKSPEVVKTEGLPVKLTGVSCIYAVKRFSYCFEAGKIYGISAPSGKGKTTLLNLINGTLTPVEGNVGIDRRYGVASVFQEPELLPHLTAVENVALPLARFYTRREALLHAAYALRSVEMEAFASSLPDTLSYGQQQRVAIARAIAYPSPFLLMDEPFKGLDGALCRRIIVRLRERQESQRQTFLFTSHRPEELKQLADEVFVLPDSMVSSTLCCKDRAHPTTP